MRSSFGQFWSRSLTVTAFTALFLLLSISALGYAKADNALTRKTSPRQTVPPVEPFVKSVLSTKARAGSTVVYQITFDNSTLVTYTGALVGLTDTLPVGLVLYGPITVNHGTVGQIPDRVITWTGELTYGTRVKIAYQALVRPDLLTTTLTNTAILWEQRGPEDWLTPTNRTLTATSVLHVQPIWPEAYLPSLSAPPTPAPVQPISVPQFLNWNFEQVNIGAWSERSNGKPSKIIYRNGEKITLVLPRYKGQDNQYFAWLGGEYSAINVLEQSIPLPTKPSQLSLQFDAWIESADECGTDIAKVLLNSQEIGTYSLCKANNSQVSPDTGGWHKQTLNIANYPGLAGQTVPVKFEVTTNGAKNSNWYIDNVRMCSTDPSVVADDRCQ